MSWLRAIPFLFTLLAFVLEPASASAFGNAHPEARVSGFELVALASVGTSATTSPPDLIEDVDSFLANEFPNSGQSPQQMLQTTGGRPTSGIKQPNRPPPPPVSEGAPPPPNAPEARAPRVCFPAGALVATERGLVPIEEIAIGERVWGWDETEDCVGLFEVTHVFVREADELVVFEAGDTTLAATPSHPFWDEQALDWVAAGELPEDAALLRGLDGEIRRVHGMWRLSGLRRVYNLEVATAHSFYVGASPVLVHNAVGRGKDLTFDDVRPDAAGGLPRPGSLSNEATRAWYKARLAEIPSRLDQSLPLRERALQAFKLRNDIKLQARELMADRAAAASLPAPRSLADVVQRAYESGARGDDVWRYVLRGSGKSNAAVDAALGL